MRRRDFLRHSFMIGASTLLPGGKLALATPAVRPFLTLPEQLKPDAQGNLTLTARTGSRVWRGNRVPVWGYNGNLPGPAIVLERGMPVNVSFYNRLPVATTVHWHGLIIPGDVDGGPHAPVEPGRQVTITFTPDQPAATCWFHPHLHSQTGYQVARGLVGMVIINDSQHEISSLPQQWGIDDIPLIFQDKRLTADGRRIDYELDVMSAAVGWFGDLPLTNGAVYPQHAVPRG